MPNLDLIRAMAVSLVLLQHILLTMRIYRIGILDISWMGYFGVFLFFLHTTVVLMWSLERNSDPIRFYIRRIFRIYPLAVFAILVTVSFHLPAIRNGNGDAVYWAPGIKNIISNLLLTQNLFWGPNILGVMWSLPIEWDMYLILPFLFVLTGHKSAFSRLLLLWAAVTVVNSLVLPAETADLAMFVPHFLAGVIAYILFSRVQPRLPSFVLPLMILTGLLTFLSFPSMRGGWLFTLVLGLALPFVMPFRAKWIVSASRQVARYSYGIYLAHPFCVLVGLKLLHQYNLAIRLAGIFFPLAAIVIPAYHFFEKPMTDIGVQLADSDTPHLPNRRPVWKDGKIESVALPK